MRFFALLVLIIAFFAVGRTEVTEVKFTRACDETKAINAIVNGADATIPISVVDASFCASGDIQTFKVGDFCNTYNDKCLNSDAYVQIKTTSNSKNFDVSISKDDKCASNLISQEITCGNCYSAPSLGYLSVECPVSEDGSSSSASSLFYSAALVLGSLIAALL